jgi:hypothetical protein
MVELVEVTSCHWMLFLNRYMKILNGFVRQREKPKGFMEKGYMVCESVCYVSEYIKQIDGTPCREVWDDH